MSKAQISLKSLAIAGVFVATLLVAFFIRTAFVAWTDSHNSIYWAAVEVGEKPIYPEGSVFQGFLLAGGTALASSLAFGLALLFIKKAGWLSLDLKSRKFPLGLGLILVGVSIPVFIQYASLGIVPLLGGLALTFFFSLRLP